MTPSGRGQADHMTDAEERPPQLSRYARTIAERMREVERAEAEFADLRRSAAQPRSRFAGILASRRLAGRRESTFQRLADAVADLCSAWQLFRLAAAGDALPWQEALALTMPDLFSDDSTQADGLRQDSAFSYAVVKSDDDVMRCFLWRLERGYC
jgi:hypothetical protein